MKLLHQIGTLLSLSALCFAILLMFLTLDLWSSTCLSPIPDIAVRQFSDTLITLE